MDQRALSFPKRAVWMALLVVTTCLAVLALCLTCTTAASAKTAKTNLTHAVDPQGGTSRFGLLLDKSLQGAHGLSASSSNSRVVANVRVEKSTTGTFKGKWELRYENTGKTGKATVTVKGTKKGKRVSEKATIKFVKYANPVASFKVGGTNYAKAFDKDTTASVDLGTSAAVKKKLSVKAKKGWKLQGVTLYVFDDSHKDQPRQVKVKNGATVSLPSGSHLTADFLNAKTGVYEFVSIDIYHYPGAALAS